MGYDPQESLENTINTYKYHGYTGKGTPNFPLSWRNLAKGYILGPQLPPSNREMNHLYKLFF